MATGPLHDLTAFQRDLLVAIRDAEPFDDGHGPHGQSISAYLEQAYGSPINHGRLYPALDGVTDMGLARKEQANRRSNVYELTDRGKRELQADLHWRAE